MTVASMSSQSKSPNDHSDDFVGFGGWGLLLLACPANVRPGVAQNGLEAVGGSGVPEMCIKSKGILCFGLLPPSSGSLKHFLGGGGVEKL